jgi:hypothetical protein
MVQWLCRSFGPSVRAGQLPTIIETCEWGADAAGEAIHARDHQHQSGDEGQDPFTHLHISVSTDTSCIIFTVAASRLSLPHSRSKTLTGSAFGPALHGDREQGFLSSLCPTLYDRAPIGP